MKYEYLDSDYTSTYRDIMIFRDENNEMFYALSIDKGELCGEKEFLPQIIQPRAEILFSDSLSFILFADAETVNDLNDWNVMIHLYTESEFIKKINGYTAERLNFVIKEKETNEPNLDNRNEKPWDYSKHFD